MAASTTFKLTRLVGESSTGIEDAITTALATSASRVRGQTWCEVSDIRANINEDGSVDRWQVQIEVAFAVEE